MIPQHTQSPLIEAHLEAIAPDEAQSLAADADLIPQLIQLPVQGEVEPPSLDGELDFGEPQR